jgi:acyl-CoA synthetase (AMP-forming)/AMP-acid ligase II
MMAGYARAEDEVSAFDEAGFYRSGDQGELCEGEFLVVTGRIKDLIIRNGENIAPKEIEDLLVGHPAIAEIAIVGVPHPRTGEQAVAVIVPRAGAQPDVATLAQHLAAHGVARFKYPEAVALWDALPRNDAGKVLKNLIREKLAAA